MRLIRCDHCQTETHPDSAVDWYKFAILDTAYVSLGASPGPWHFCSIHCAARFLDRQEQPQRVARQGE